MSDDLVKVGEAMGPPRPAAEWPEILGLSGPVRVSHPRAWLVQIGHAAQWSLFEMEVDASIWFDRGTSIGVRQSTGLVAPMPDPTRTTLRDVGRALGAAMPGLGEAAREEGEKSGAIGRVIAPSTPVPGGHVGWVSIGMGPIATHVRWLNVRAPNALVAACRRCNTDLLPDGALLCGRCVAQQAAAADTEYVRIVRSAPDPETVPRCPSLHCDRPIKRLESGVYFCPSCSWHGRELTPPAAAPRFSVGSWVLTAPSATLAQVVAIRSTPHGRDAWQYSLANTDESGVVERNESALSAAERPR